MPMLEDIYKGSVAHIVSLGEDAAQLQKDLHRRALRYLKKYFNSEKNQIKADLKPETSHRREVIRIWLENNGLGQAINRSLIERIDDLWLVKNNGRAVKHGNFEIMRHKKYLWLRIWNL